MNTLCIFPDTDALQTWVTEFAMMAPSVKWKVRGRVPVLLDTGYETYHLKLMGEDIGPMRYDRIMDYTEKKCQKEPGPKSSSDYRKLTIVSGGKSDS